MGWARHIGWLPLSLVSMTAMSAMIIFIFSASVKNRLPIHEVMLGISCIFFIGFSLLTLWKDPLLLILVTGVAIAVMARILSKFEGHQLYVMIGLLVAGGLSGVVHNLTKYPAIHLAAENPYAPDCYIALAIISCSQVPFLIYLYVTGQGRLDPISLGLITTIFLCVAALNIVPYANVKAMVKTSSVMAAGEPTSIVNPVPLGLNLNDPDQVNEFLEKEAQNLRERGILK